MTKIKEGATSPVLELQAITKVYPCDPPLPILHGLDLRIDEGELAAIVGPSGSGKSTLLHIMGTLDSPTSGQVLLRGTDVTGLSDHELSRCRATSIGFVFQQFFLLDGRTAVDNVADGLLYQGTNRQARLASAHEALEQVGLAHRAKHHPNKLSGGERQRVAIARALVHRPALLLADEPTGNLDTAAANGIVELLKELSHHGSTIVVITHNPELAAELPRQITIRDGRIESDHRTWGDQQS